MSAKRPFWRRSASSPPPGAAPGTLLADPEAPPPVIRILAYGPDGLEERSPATVEDVAPLLEAWPVVWINVDGLGDAELVRRLGELLDLHPLALEDVLNVRQRAKVEAYGETVFLVARMVSVQTVLQTEQLSLFLGEGCVLTFQERAGDCFDPVRERLRHGKGRLRGTGADYLAYALVDAVVDHGFPVLEYFGERLEDMEDAALLKLEPDTLSRIHQLRRDLLTLRRALWPLRDVMMQLTRERLPVFTEDTRLYLRDCYDHVLRLIDLVETYRELGASLIDLHLTTLSNRMNDVMKVLTIMSTIFIPLSFLAGLYGMNFDPDASPWNMPELSWAYGYPAALGFMAVSAGLMLFFFWRKGWLSSLQLPEAPANDDRSAR